MTSAAAVLKLFALERGCDFEEFARLFVLRRPRSALEKEALEAMARLRGEPLEKMRSAVERCCERRCAKLYLLDSMGLPDIFAVWCRAKELGLHADVQLFHNPSGNTAGFKRVFGAETMREVARRCGSQLVALPDEDLHRGPTTLEKTLQLLRGRMARLAGLTAEGVMIFADHGYDVKRDGELYMLFHGKGPFSRLAPLIYVTKPV